LPDRPLVEGALVHLTVAGMGQVICITHINQKSDPYRWKTDDQGSKIESPALIDMPGSFSSLFRCWPWGYESFKI
jgi:hypothetical protein